MISIAIAKSPQKQTDYAKIFLHQMEEMEDETY